jgi:ubiquitin-like modifier-activating enzyme ATG7
MKLSFEPFVGVITPAFWAALSRKKLDHLGLDEEPLTIYGYHLIGQPGAEPRFYLDESAFDEHSQESLGTCVEAQQFWMRGKLMILNTLDRFKTFNRTRLLEEEKRQQLGGSATPNQFILLAFADLKKWKYYYQLCFPVLFSTSQPVEVELIAADNASKDAIVLYDSSGRSESVAGWNVRQKLMEHGSDLRGFTLIRKGVVLHYRVISNPGKDASHLEITGWEKNAQGKPIPHVIDLSTSMDPVRLAQEAAQLNLKLIKWRLMPGLDLSKMAEAKCLLFGAGTLGCNVTRSLLGWGVNHITLVDNGRVSYSNPVRQSLFLHEDSVDGGKPKAETAAMRATQIAPFANISGVSLSIPMPGHIIVDQQQFRDAFAKIDDLVRSHDVVFLLTDSRESRWLPSLLGSAHDKLVITVALGFDSFVVMRHGNGSNGLGCYFCNDVNSPGDTMSGRTLDQQCTVTRPGLSFLASSVAVELMASILQHPLGKDAPATPSAAPTEPVPQGASMLGAVPHQIRGFLSHFQNLILTGDRFSCCPSCSPKVSLISDGIPLLTLTDPAIFPGGRH